jgi:polynucleotide 5'-triphosphatase
MFVPSPLIIAYLKSSQDVMHELEVEIARPQLLLSTAVNRGNPSVSDHERNAFDELIRAFVNNARTLVRNVTVE